MVVPSRLEQDLRPRWHIARPRRVSPVSDPGDHGDPWYNCQNSMPLTLQPCWRSNLNYPHRHKAPDSNESEMYLVTSVLIDLVQQVKEDISWRIKLRNKRPFVLINVGVLKSMNRRFILLNRNSNLLHAEKNPVSNRCLVQCWWTTSCEWIKPSWTAGQRVAK